MIVGISRLAGAAGFEPANAGTKNRCLTTWRRPSRRIRMCGRGRAYRRALSREKSLCAEAGLDFGQAACNLAFDRSWKSKIMALELRATERAHGIRLYCSLNAFGGGLNPKFTGEREQHGSLELRRARTSGRS